jgi:hypothetical protein
MTPSQRARLAHLMNRLTDDLLSVMRAHREEIEFAARNAFGVETEFVSFAAFSSAAAITAHLVNDRGYCDAHSREMTNIVMRIASENCMAAATPPTAGTISVH